MRIEYKIVCKDQEHAQRIAMICFRSEIRREKFAAQRIVVHIKEDFPQYHISMSDQKSYCIYIKSREEYDILKQYYREAKKKVKREMWMMQLE